MAEKPRCLAMPSPNSGSALKKFLMALSWMSLGTGFMWSATFFIVASLALSHITFLNRSPGWVKSSLGWLGLCLATSPVTRQGSYLASLLNRKVFCLPTPIELGSQLGAEPWLPSTLMGPSRCPLLTFARQGQLTGICSQLAPSLCLWVSGQEKSRPCNILSMEGSMPGTRWPGEKAACSVSAKKLSGFLLRTMVPTGMRGQSFWETTLVTSNMFHLQLQPSFSGIAWMKRSHSAVLPWSRWVERSLTAQSGSVCSWLAWSAVRFLMPLLVLKCSFTQ